MSYVPRVTLDVLGVIDGKTKYSLGNLGNERKPYYLFRNLPYATGVADKNRYKVILINFRIFI